MTAILALLVTVATWQQPQTPSGRGVVMPPDPVPKTLADTTLAQLVAIGRVVADVRTEIDRFRMRAFNNGEGDLLASSAMFRTRCQELAVAAQNSRRIMCRNCLSRTMQPSIDRYRAFLPSLARLGNRCAATLGRLRVADSAVAAGNLRREARNISNFMTVGLRQYEARLLSVRQAMSAPPPPRRGG